MKVITILVEAIGTAPGDENSVCLLMEHRNSRAKISIKNNPPNQNSSTTKLISAVYCNPNVSPLIVPTHPPYPYSVEYLICSLLGERVVSCQMLRQSLALTDSQSGGHPAHTGF